MRARTGKIARLPLLIRDELNQRLLEGQPAREIMEWVNALPETERLLAEMRSAMAYGGAYVGPIDDRNISDWRKGGYTDWLGRRERLEQTRELAQFAGRVARASGNNLSDGAAAILSGEILEVLEGAAMARDGQDAAETASALAKLTKALVALRDGDHNREMVDLKREKVALDARALELDQMRFQRQTCELFLKWSEDQRARNLLNGGGDNAEKITALGELMFGADWKER